jgi:hypothetical protein
MALVLHPREHAWFERLRGLGLAIALVSCGTSGAASSDAGAQASDAGELDGGATDSSAFAIGSHAPFPKVPSNGGPVLASPHVITITFDGSADAAQLSAFGDFLVKSSWLSAVGADYGIGSATHEHVALGAAPTGTVADADVQALLAARIADKTLPSAATDAGVSDYVYVVFFPSGTDVTLPQAAGGNAICSLGPMAAYHWEASSPRFAYAVVPACAFQGVPETLDQRQQAAAHEIMEAVTDPFPATAPAFAIVDANDPWAAGGGEVADLCEGELTTESTFTLPRIWSNGAASANDRSPCIPFSGTFFDASVSSAAGKASKAVPVSPGHSVSMVVEGFSTQPIDPWQLETYVVAGLSSFNPSPVLAATTIGNGETTSLSLTVPASAKSQTFATVLLYSRSGSEMHSWPVVVYAP